MGVPDVVRCPKCHRPCPAVCNTHTVHAVFGRMMRHAMNEDQAWAVRMTRIAQLGTAE